MRKSFVCFLLILLIEVSSFYYLNNKSYPNISVVEI